MSFLKLISPKQVPRKKSNWKFRHKFYKAMLKLYLRLYSRGVIEDCVEVNEVVIMHSLRDPWFEKELKRFGIEFEPSLHSAQIESLKKRKYHRHRTFNWEDKLVVMHIGKSCGITRGNNVGFDTNMEGHLQASTDKDGILSVLYRGRNGRRLMEKKTVKIEEPKDLPEKPQTPHVPPKKKTIHIKDTVKPRQEKPRVEEPKESAPQDSYTKHAGFEENDIF